MTPVNSIEIPDEFREVAIGNYAGQGDTLYAIASTGGLTLGSICPAECIDEDKDTQDRKHYVTLWASLSADVSAARRGVRAYAETMANRLAIWDATPDEDEDEAQQHEELRQDTETAQYEEEVLTRFETWVDETLDRLRTEYNLEDF
jgi:hypothetical protein